jgi:hypothetical protein
MTNDQARCIELYKAGILKQTIVIHAPNADFTPKGKRRAKVISHKHNGEKAAKHLAWYVGRSLYRSLQLTVDNVNLTNQWLSV